ncbi:bacillithiol biosynthesis deacetylase BshB1 [Deinococcus sp. Leaf326]|jgi:bacillithiol biosynthesis deacetylase BshB1|uniref:bacillithiol biosynthesis deacetylase BshB1 n=1 Tax=Deinococcus sp. Leaf326 TaxID=1736338 RepID=UPI000700D84D|nr:bacillithiol biosynthesis deacetylase BshB1 [Deinococcus sp. Leaf326]KQR15627.1 bacillithiol biosynthesis deacetylase BshB1 [Deinococcus sp. Leaf326]
MSTLSFQTTYGEVQPLDWLCLAPHPDDAEIGAGGTLIRLARSGRAVGILELSRGEKGTQGTPEERAAECVAAARIMGLAWRGQQGLRDGELADTPAAAHALAATLRAVRPRVLVVPHHLDRHPDHFGTYQLARRAVHLSALAKAEVAGEPWRVGRVLLYQGNADIRANVLVDVGAVMEPWEAAIRAHTSQFSGGYVSETVTPEIIERRRGRLTYWGTLLRVQYAEPFEAEDPLLLDPLGL